MDIAAWLRELGLERYEEAFRENEIDAEILPKLTTDDLKDIGVAAVGHRRKLFEAIGALVELASAPQAAPTSPAQAELRARPPEAERRQLTVMFVDLVGSTKLSARLDPEEMSAIIRAYQNAAAGEITRFEGHIAKYMGDGVLAYFGYPKAHEDEAERAVRAGLAITDAVSHLSSPVGEALAARVGIATGLVVVGELIGEGSSAEQAVVGETPNLAARLQTLAEPGGVVIAASTRRLLGGLFELVDLGAHDLKGFVEPVGALRVIGEGRAESRFEALRGTRITPLVGREHELSLLLDRWSLAKAGEGQVVLLSGEAGIGKSRITRALLGRLGDETYTRLRYHCSPYHTNSALHPVIDQLERATGFAADDDPEVKLDKLEAVLGQASERIGEVAPLLASLLSIPTGGRYPPLNLTSQAQKAKTFEALIGQLVGLATHQPVVINFEDAHWLDPTTSELLELVIDRLHHLPILLLIAFRLEFSPPWTGAHVTSLTLNRLGRNQAAAMVAGLTDGKRLPDEVLNQIVQKTDGVPLFVEELTKTVLESGQLRETAEAFVLDGPLLPLAIPATLHDSLMARLDRLAPVKEVAQIGAVIGREFSYELLSAVCDDSHFDLTAALDQLVVSELIFRRGMPPDATYAFKHSLVQDVAYNSLLRSKRAAIHDKIATVLQDHFPAVVDTDPELLAYHLTEAGSAQKAVIFWLAAGEKANRRSANLEAIRHLARGLELIRVQSESLDQAQTELRLQLCLGRALIATKGYADSDVERAYARAQVLCQQTGNASQLYTALMGLEAYYFARADLKAAQKLAEQSLNVAKRSSATDSILNSYHQIGVTLFHAGEIGASLSHFENALELYSERCRDLPHMAQRFQNPGVACQCYAALALWHLGYIDQASIRQRGALDMAYGLSQPFSLAYALCLSAWLSQYFEKPGEVREFADAAISVSVEHKFRFWLAIATCFRGWALVALGQGKKGVARLEDGISLYRATGARVSEPHWLALLASACGRLGEPLKGLAILSSSLRAVECSEERYYEPELHLLKGELLLDLTRRRPQKSSICNEDRTSVEADACIQEAMRLARRQKAKTSELRAASSLARLWAEGGERQKALDLLAPIYGWFTEGFDTNDLKQAKALLNELA